MKIITFYFSIILRIHLPNFQDCLRGQLNLELSLFKSILLTIIVFNLKHRKIKLKQLLDLKK